MYGQIVEHGDVAFQHIRLLYLPSACHSCDLPRSASAVKYKLADNAATLRGREGKPEMERRMGCKVDAITVVFVRRADVQANAAEQNLCSSATNDWKHFWHRRLGWSGSRLYVGNIAWM